MGAPFILPAGAGLEIPAPFALPEIDPFDPNTFPEESPDDACFICLSNDHDLHAIVDRQDFAWARALTWCHTYGSGEFVELFPDYWVSPRPDHIYARNCAGGTTRWLHREILIRAEGKPRFARAMGDHKNGNTLDCRRRNLRWATPATEFGQAHSTLALLAAFTGHDLQACGEAELARVSTPEFIAKLRGKRATRHGRGPLPGFSAPGSSEPPATVEADRG